MPQTWAVVFRQAGRVAFERVEVPPLEPGEVRVRTTWSWISNGTEGSFLRGERANGETPSSEAQPAPFPIVPGYQRIGEVVEVGEGSGFAVGETVFVTVSKVAGLATPSGGHVHIAPARAEQVRRLPVGDGPPPEAYAGLVLTQVGYNCGMRPSIEPGGCAVVLGDGLVGHWSAQTLAHRRADVLLAGRHDTRLQRFSGRGVNTRSEDLTAIVAEWAAGRLQAIIDTVGSVACIESLLPYLRHRGHVVSAGYCHDRGQIDIQKLRFREATLHAPSGWTGPRLDATLAAVQQGWLQTLPLVTHRFAAPDVAAAWRCIDRERDETLGVLLDWREVTA